MKNNRILSHIRINNWKYSEQQQQQQNIELKNKCINE